MFDPTIRFDSLREQVLDSIANGAALASIARRRDGLAGSSNLPAALLDSDLVYLAANRPYAGLFNLPRSAFVASGLQQVQGDTLQTVRMLNASGMGEALRSDAGQTVPGMGGTAPHRLVVTPLKCSGGLPPGLLVEYHPERFGKR